MRYRVHIGTGIEDAKGHSSICEFTHEFLSELVEVIEGQPEITILISNFNEKEKYIELNYDVGGLQRFKEGLNKLEVKKNIASHFECLLLACDKAHKHKMHLYIVME